MKKTLALSSIVVDDAIQSRAAIDPETVESYKAAYADGADLPPLAVVDDDGTFYLWDGFHRHRALTQLGREKVAVVTTVGSRRDAILLSCGANAEHGRQRSREDKKRAVALLIQDEDWVKEPVIWFARNVRISEQLVRQLLEELGVNRTAVKRSDGRIVPATKPKKGDRDRDHDGPASTPSEKSAPAVDSDTTPEADSETAPEPVAEPAGGYVDQFGHTVPPQAVPAWESIPELKRIVGVIKDAAKDLHAWIKGPGGRYLISSNVQQLEAVARSAWSAKPAHVCCYCRGENADCKACLGTGWISERVYQNAPPEKRNPF